MATIDTSTDLAFDRVNNDEQPFNIELWTGATVLVGGMVVICTLYISDTFEIL